MIRTILNKKTSRFFLAWLCACGVGVFLRLYPLTHYASFDSSEKATALLLSNIRAQVTRSVDENFPTLSREEKAKAIAAQMNEILRNNPENFKGTVEKISRTLEAESNAATSYPYLLASDSYYYYGLTENIRETGKISETIKGSKFLHKLMLAPLGHWEPLNLHPFVGYFIYRVLKVFDPSIPLMYAVSFTPLVVTVLALIPFFIICFILGCSASISFLGSIFFLIADVFLKRSMFGWYDNDPYTIFFSLMICAVLLNGFRYAGNRKQSIVLAISSAFLMTLYSLFWHGWMFFLIILVVAGILAAAYSYFVLRDKNQTQNLFRHFGILAAATFIGVTVIFGIKDFFALFYEGWTALKNFLEPQLAVWPDLYLSVGELKKISFSKIIQLTGGIPFFGIAVLGLGAMLVRSYKKPESRLSAFFAIFLTIFLIASFVLAHGALRFSLFCLIPLSITFPLGLQWIFDRFRGYLLRFLSSHQHRDRIFQGICVLLILIPTGFLVRQKYASTPQILNKIYNSAWDRALKKARKLTPEESIINSWWPPGHFIKAIAKRKVVFDGASINKPQGYWLASILLDTDEKEAIGLLRMLNTSANQAAEYLENSGVNSSTAVKTLKIISKFNRRQAKLYLQTHLELTDTQTDTLLDLTHQRPPASYLMIYNEMIEKNIEFKFIAGWNFKKMEELKENPEALAQVPARGSKEYIQWLWNMAGGPYRYSGILDPIAQKGDSILFVNNVQINIKTKDCRISSPEYGKGIPRSIFYLNDDKVAERKFADSTLPYSVILFQESDVYRCVLLDRKFARSLLMTLYFFNGKGMNYLEPLIKEKDFTGRTEIKIFKIDWDKFIIDLNKNTVI